MKKILLIFILLAISWKLGRIPWIEPILRITSTPSPVPSQSLVCASGPGVAIERANLSNLAEFEASLDRIKNDLGIDLVYQSFPASSSQNDWQAYLDSARKKGFKLVVTFADSPPRPLTQGVDLGITGRFLSVMKDHPALYAIFLIDEPFHQKHGFKITSEKLRQMYSATKSLAPKVPVLVQFSREIEKMEEKGKQDYRFSAGMCDICQISALEFRNYGQGNKFYKDDLISNHTVSRKIIKARFPQAKVFSSAQVFGNRLGKSSYYFPSIGEFNQMLDLLLSDQLAKDLPLAGLNFQTWTAETTQVSSQQQNLSSPESSAHRAAVKKLCTKK